MPSLPLDPRAPLLAVLAIAGSVAPAPQARAADPTGSASLTNDYVWRGSTQTVGDPAVQAGFRITGESGLYASAWGSNVKFAPGIDASAEMDFTVGWSKALGNDWAVDVGVMRYQYPSAPTGLNWTELNGSLTWKDNYWAAVGYSNEALGYGANGLYVLAGARFPVNDAFRIEASVGHYHLNDAVVARSGYAHGQLSAIWALKAPFELRLSAHGTDDRAKAIFGNDYAGTRLEAALQANF